MRTLRRNLWRITSATLLAALSAITLGISIPKVVNKITDELYPCMYCSCGCPSAEACWRDCCCYSQTEKIAWANEHGVTPPSFVLAASETEPSSLEDLPPCCRKRLAARCAKEGESNSSEEALESVSPAAKRIPAKTISRTVVLIDVLRCQGLVNHLTGLPPCVVPSPVASVDGRSVPSENVVYRHAFYSGLLSPPDPPPPKREV